MLQEENSGEENSYESSTYQNSPALGRIVGSFGGGGQQHQQQGCHGYLFFYFHGYNNLLFGFHGYNNLFPWLQNLISMTTITLF